MERRIKMDTLNQVTNKYLEENGITIRFFAEYINCEYTRCAKWLKGERNLSPKQIERTHIFLSGKFLKSVDQILKEE